MKWTEQTIAVFMSDRLTHLQAAIADASRLRIARRFKGVNLLHELFHRSHGPLSGLTLEFIKARTGSGTWTYIDWEGIDKGTGARFRIEPILVQKFLEVAIQAERFGYLRDFWHFDLFLIHELLHSYQGMERGRHGGYQVRSPEVLLSLDYESDAVAVTTLISLLLLSPEHFFLRFRLLGGKRRKSTSLADLVRNTVIDLAKNVRYWEACARVIRAHLWHMAAFTARMIDTTDPMCPPNQSLYIASTRPFTIVQLERIFAWQLQYFRTKCYRVEGRLSELGILRQPRVEFRNLRSAIADNPKLAKKDWPAQEARFISGSPRTDLLSPADPAVIMAVQGQYGLGRIIPWKTGSDTTLYSGLFESLFTGTLDTAEPFFHDLFRSNPWLIGYYDNPILGGVPNPAEVSAALTKKRDRNDVVALSDARVRQKLARDIALIN